MAISKEMWDLLLPRTPLKDVILSIPKDERLPTYQKNSLPLGKELPLEIVEQIMKIGTPTR